MEEADESHFWLGLIVEGGYLPAAKLREFTADLSGATDAATYKLDYLAVL